MTISAALVGAQVPALVQVVVSEAPDGEAWTVTGSTGSFTWTVPGGSGVGDGEQLVLIDNMAPPNTPVTYTFTSASVTEESDPITVPLDGDLALHTLDGQRSVVVNLMDGSLDTELPSNTALFHVPGRARPVVRYTALSDVVSSLVVRVPTADANAFRAVLASGAPIIYRSSVPLEDTDPVGVIAVTSVRSRLYFLNGFRDWVLGFAVVDNPFQDQALGAFSWDFFDEVWADLDWDDFDASMSGRTWDEFDALDWTTV